MKIVIVGAGEVGSHLAKMLSREGSEITVIDTDGERLSRLAAVADVATVQGSPTSIGVLRSAAVDRADLFIAVFPSASQEVNIVSSMLARSIGATHVTARICDEEYLSAENKLLFKEVGIELLFYPERIAADEIVGCVKNSSSSETMDFAHGKLRISVFRMEDDSPALDMKVSELSQKFSQEEGQQFRIISISRENETIIPRADTVLQYHDLVYTVASREGARTLMNLFGMTPFIVDKVMIYGGGAIAEMVARSLSGQVSSIKIIEKDKSRCLEMSERLSGTRVKISCGDGRNSDFLLEEGIREYDAFIALTPSDETNVLACVVAKKLGIGRTIAEVENIEYMRLAEDMGVDNVINKKLSTAGRIFRFTLSDKARFVKYMTGTSAEILEYTVAPGSAITKAPLRELDFPSDAVIGGVIRGDESFIAVGETIIEDFDRVVVFALGETVAKVDKFFK